MVDHCSSDIVLILLDFSTIVMWLHGAMNLLPRENSSNSSGHYTSETMPQNIISNISAYPVALICKIPQEWLSKSFCVCPNNLLAEKSINCYNLYSLILNLLHSAINWK